MRRAAVNDDWGSCGAGICEPLVARFAKPFCAAHFPLAATLLVIVAKSLRCAAGCSITTLLVHGIESVLWRKTIDSGPELDYLVRLVCRICCCMARGARAFKPLRMESFSHTPAF